MYVLCINDSLLKHFTVVLEQFVYLFILFMYVLCINDSLLKYFTVMLEQFVYLFCLCMYLCTYPAIIYWLIGTGLFIIYVPTQALFIDWSVLFLFIIDWLIYQIGYYLQPVKALNVISYNIADFIFYCMMQAEHALGCQFEFVLWPTSTLFPYHAHSCSAE